MEDVWKRVMLALALSLALPNIILNAGSKMSAQQPSQPTQPAVTAPTTVPVQTTAAPDRDTLPALTIPVLTDDGSVELMELETYVLGVVLAEMPAYFDAEALKAQAVAARTYTLRRLYLGDKHSQCAVCTRSSCCQAWICEERYLQQRGTQKDLEKVTQAVAATAGEIVIYGAQPADCTYFACSGGRTESAEAVWGVAVSYLVSVDSPGEELASAFSTDVSFTAREFAACLGRELAGKPTQWLGAQTYTDGGGVATMVIAGITYSGKELRSLLKLDSTAFSMAADENGIHITAYGKGHRVGMSQYGANAMAQAGADYLQILQHYYPGTDIDKIDSMG